MKLRSGKLLIAISEAASELTRLYYEGASDIQLVIMMERIAADLVEAAEGGE